MEGTAEHGSSAVATLPAATGHSSRSLPGTRGLDIFRIAGQSISGWLPSYKTGGAGKGIQPFTTQMEFLLALYLEYHPWVTHYQRGDMSADFARAHKLPAPLGTPYGIAYTYEGRAHTYLPDWVGTLGHGGLVVAEAGVTAYKVQAQAWAKADAGPRWAHIKGGYYWLGTEDTLAVQYHWNLVFLHARRESFPTFGEIAPEIERLWRSDRRYSVNALIALLARRWSEAEVEAAAWKLAGDAAAHGQLLVDLTQVALTRDTEMALLDPHLPPILPPALPEALDDASGGDSPPPEPRGPAMIASPSPHVPGPTIDAEQLPPPVRATFLRHLAAVSDVLAGQALCAVARQYGYTHQRLGCLVRRAQSLGQVALVPYRSYRRASALHAEFKTLARKLWTAKDRPTVMAVAEHWEMRDLAARLTEQEGRPVPWPTYGQIYRYLATLRHNPAVAAARSGLRHPPRARQSATSYVLSIPAPALVCQVDEHHLDLNVVTGDGVVLTDKVHAAVLICVKTAAILGAVLSLDALEEEDYMRLLKQALEPKELLTRRYECRHAWPCVGKPSIILQDRGPIFTSERARQVVVERLRIVSETAPPYAPTVKETVEALFTWVAQKFAHRLPGTTKSTPLARGAYDSAKEAGKAGITLDLLEQYFYRAIVDGYMQEGDPLRRQRRITLWEEAVRTYGVPRWLGTPDDLLLLLMKRRNRKRTATGHYAVHPGKGISFYGRWYVSPGLLDRLSGLEIDIYYDRRDISVIYLFVDGAYCGEAYCTAFMGRRVSLWEASAERKAAARLAKEGAHESREARADIGQQARRGRAALRKEARALERQRQLDLQRPEIHPGHVQAVLQAIAESTQQQARPASPSPLAPAVADGPLAPARRPAIRHHGDRCG